MRISSVIFFGTILIMIVIVSIISLTNIKIDYNYLQFWWVVLVPLAFYKVFLPKSKFSIWMNKIVFVKLIDKIFK